jgi:hypothetical protein
MVLTVLSKIKSLKSNDLFSTVAAPEVEEAFLQVSDKYKYYQNGL